MTRLMATALVTLAAACSALPEISSGVCGNLVIEGEEACDGYGRDGVRCRSPNSVDECQLDCSPNRNGARPSCPTGWGCGTDDVCRQASGSYRALETRIAGNAASLMTGDFDGDGRGDVLALESPGTLGAAKFRLHYLDADGELAETWSAPRTTIALSVAQIPGDARSDIALSVGNVAVMLGQPDRALISQTYPSYSLRNGGVRVAGVIHDLAVDQAGPLVALLERDGQASFARPDKSTLSLLSVAQLPATIDRLAGDPVTADVFADDPAEPCRDVVVAIQGEHAARVYSFCALEPGTDQAIWREDVAVASIPLEADAEIQQGPLIADANGDGKLDLWLRATDRAWLALGDGRSLSDARPVEALVDGVRGSIDMPLAAGDFTGDGLADLVYPTRFLFSLPSSVPGELAFHSMFAEVGSNWTQAHVVDLNADGMPDVIAASNDRLDLDYFNGTGSETINPSLIPTERPVKYLTVGDLDGDLIQDVAFSLMAPPGQPSSVMLAFGEPAGPPRSVTTVARVADIEQLGVLTQNGRYSNGDLFVVYAQSGSEEPEGPRGAALAAFGGLNRSLLCLVELTNFAANAGIESATAVALTVGAFSREGQLDLLAIGVDLKDDGSAPGLSLWLMPDLQSRTGLVQSPPWTLDPRLSVLRGYENPSALQLRTSVLMAASDLDADGLDDLLVAGPDVDGEHCLVTSGHLVASGDTPQFEAREPVVLGQTCTGDGQIAARDLDGDGAPDLVLLSGSPGEPRSLLVLWNDGHGEFGSAPVETLTLADEAPQAFTLFQPTQDAAVVLAYVTDERVHMLRAARSGRQFEPFEVTPELRLEHGTGITATDVDGDTIVDLVVADSGDVRVFKAELR